MLPMEKSWLEPKQGEPFICANAFNSTLQGRFGKGDLVFFLEAVGTVVVVSHLDNNINIKRTIMRSEFQLYFKSK